MGKIESDIGGRSFEGGGQRTFTVSDETEISDAELKQMIADRHAARAVHAQQQASIPEGAVEHTPEEFNAMRRNKVMQDKVATPDVKQRIEMLTGIGRMTKNVPVNTGDQVITFTLKTLKSKESKALAKKSTEIANSGDASQIYDIRALALAFSIEKIDGVDVDDVLGIGDVQDTFNARFMFINELDETVCTYLMNEYQKMVSDNKKRFGIETAEDAKEVAQQMNKSS